MAARWEHVAHGADVGVRGIGLTMAEAFAGAGLALTAAICDPALVEPREEVPIRCDAPSPDLLLVDWLNALIYEMATRHLLFGAFDVALEGTTLRATARGEPVDRRRHQPAVEVKGATLTGLRVGQEPDGRWIAECVVDV